MKNIKMMAKLIISFGAVAVVVLLVAYFGLSGAQQLGNHIRNIGTVSMPQIQALMAIDKEMITVDDSENSLLAPGLPANLRQEAYQTFADAKKTADSEIKAFESIEMTGKEKSDWNTFLSQYNQWWSDHLKFTEYAKTYETTHANADLTAMLQWGLESGMKSFNAASKSLQTMIQIQRKEAAATVATASSEVDQVRLIAIIAMIAGTAIAMLLGIILALSISRPLARGVRFAEMVAAGDFTQKLDINQRDEIGLLARALNEMSEKLRDLILSIRDSASQVAASSEEIAASTQTMSQDTQVQASTVEETAAAMEELSASVTQVNEHAQNQAAAVEQGSASMSQVAKSIDEISGSLDQISTLAGRSVDNSTEGAKSVGEVVDAIKLIAEGSEKISGIVTIISEISDQTNLLALNASIEAARAGEHGRGFAVVADEVSRLADRSSSSAKEIEILIRESVKNVESGVQIATSTQGPMEQIREASLSVKDMILDLSSAMQQQLTAVTDLTRTLENVKEMSDSISVATEEQSTNARQVSKAVENVSELTQRSSAATEEMASSTEELSAMAQELQSQTAQFKTDGGGSEATPRKLGAPVRSQNHGRQAAFISWSNGMAIGEAGVDNLRKELLNGLNGLHDAVRAEKDSTIQTALIDRVASTAGRLFEAEERASIKSRIVNGNGYVSVRNELARRLDNLKTQVETGDHQNRLHTLESMRDWFKTHFLTSQSLLSTAAPGSMVN